MSLLLGVSGAEEMQENFTKFGILSIQLIGCKYTDGYHRDHYKYYYKGFSCSCGWKTGDEAPYRIEFIGCVPY